MEKLLSKHTKEVFDRAHLTRDYRFDGTRKCFDEPLFVSETTFKNKFGVCYCLNHFLERGIMANILNPISIIIPCHRVIGSNGSLTGLGGGIEAKTWLSNHEIM